MPNHQKNSYENILQDFFYPEHDIQQQVLSITQRSLLDSLTIKQSRWKIKELLSNWELPSEYLYLAWADIYNKNCFSINSPYHAVSLLEAAWLLKNAQNLDKYLWETIIDIWCWNWSKPASLLKYMKENWLWSNIKKYIWLDWSVSMLKATEDNFHKAKIPDMECEVWKQRFQELESENIQWKKTFAFLGWSLWTFSNEQELFEFLKDVKDNMDDEDAFVATVFTLPEDTDKQEISDEELNQLQKRFIKAERERYDMNNLWEEEKQKDVDMMRLIWVDFITTKDIDVDFFFDEASQSLIDRKIFNKNIILWWDVLFEKWFAIDSPWIELNRHFFQPMIEKKIKDFSESIYNTNQSREFVINFFDKYLRADINKLAYKAERNETTNTMEIFVECLDNIDFHIKWDVVKKNKWDKIMIHKSHRFTHDEIENKFSESWFQILDWLQIWWDLELLKKLVHEELMKIYVLKKK